ncbi:MAG: radical SAM protein [Dehalococcoidia bacterium]
MRIGVIELLTGNCATRGLRGIGSYLYTRQYASLMPQAVSAWCREFGHQVHYATFAGRGDPKSLLPADLDIVFVGTNTPASALAYALAKLYRQEHALTVVGGPHARAFPLDCARFFDIVVQQCDKELVRDIVDGACEPGSIVSSDRPLTDLPSVEQRMPEIRKSMFLFGRPNPTTTVGVIASLGCPYTCNFCTDWNNPYVLLPAEKLAADLRYLAEHLPGTRVAFHDPNFAVRFDEVLDVLEQIPPKKRNPYIMESSLTVLKGSRLQRLKDTNCTYVAPGVESWSGYSNKSGARTKTGHEKMEMVAEEFRAIHEYVQGLQANFIFGLDADEGDEPVELTKEFITRTPFVWPAINIPTPFGGTPFFDDCVSDGRILRSMPFALYYIPHLVTTLKHYDPIGYYERLIDINVHLSSAKLLRKRLGSTRSRSIQLFFLARTSGTRQRVNDFRAIIGALKSDAHMLAFHEGEDVPLPSFYRHEVRRMLGQYASLLSEEDLLPVLDQYVSTASRALPLLPARLPLRASAPKMSV